MSFFKEFKEDLSQAVNELVTDNQEQKDEEVISNEEYAEMVNTLDIPPQEENEETEHVMNKEINNIDMENDYLAMAAANSNTVFNEPVNIQEPEEIEETMENKSASDENAEITKGTKIEGNISSEGSINLEGKVKGNVTCLGKLVISGEIVGASKASEIYTNNSKINGDVTSEGSIKIGNGSVIIGNVYATSAVIGGAIKGDIDVKGPVILDCTAVVQGNIKSRSVQINNGAVIEGIVSQCYAEIDYNALFDDTFSK